MSSPPLSSSPEISISLHTPTKPHGPNHPSPSGYCQKLETFFRLVNFTQYTDVPSTFQSSPTGKLPYITLHPSNEVIPDSHFIIRQLISRGLVRDPDASLTAAQKTDSRALCIWTEQHLYPCVVYTRWAWDDNYQHVKTLIPIPGWWVFKEAVMYFLRRRIVNIMVVTGVGRYSRDELLAEIEGWVDAVETKLDGGKNDWVLGTEEPGIVDATVWGFLANMFWIGRGNAEAVNMLRKRVGTMAFFRRGAGRWFPEYDVETLVSGEGEEVGGGGDRL